MSDSHHDSKKNHFGFWIYIMSDCVMFAALFATYVVLKGSTNSGPTSHELFSMPYVLTETMILLTSSFTYGLAILSARKHNKNLVLGAIALTFLLGASFIGMELNEFCEILHEGHSWQTSAFLSGFFTLVATHGLHVTFGLIWMVCVFLQIAMRGITEKNADKLACLGLFWHFLDVIWIFVFTVVYLMGTI